MKQLFLFCGHLPVSGRLKNALVLTGSMLVFFLIFMPAKGYSQTGKKTITGKVTDTLGVGLPGVTVAVVNKVNVGTQTDNNGKFVLDVAPGEILRFSYVGYREYRITVSAANVINVKLAEENMLSEEVVITALGQKQRKEALVGSVTTVKVGNLKIPSSNLTNALSGQIAGVIGYQRSGQPGQDNSQFFIRGVTTFGYKRDPLILIDNVELSTSDLARLQVDDIESFSILKDASATALYGARGANGVILVATKSGKEGKAKINFRLEQSASQSVQNLELADPITYMRLFNEAAIGRGMDPMFTPNQIINTQATVNKSPGYNQYVYPAVDWLDMLFKKRTSTQRANLGISGGGGVARYYIAGSYNLDNGVLKQDDRNNNDNNIKFRNYQLRSNINIDLSKTTEMVVRLSGNFSEYNGPLATDGGFSTDLYNIAVHTSPVSFPAFYPADAANQNAQHILFGNRGGAGVNSILDNNPYAAMLRGHKNSSESRMSAQFEVNQKLDFFTDGLSFKSIFSTNRYSYFDSQRAYSPFYYNIGSYDKQSNTYVLNWLNSSVTGGAPNIAQEYLSYNPGGTNINTFLYAQASLNYDKAFGNHNVSGTLIGTAQQTVYSNASSLQNSLPYRNLGLAGRLTYSYKSRYFIESNFGYNGSERFSENHRFGFFPTIGAGWVLSNEKFWTGDLANVVNRLKLRGSYGIVGNDAIGAQRFFYISDVNLNGGGNYAQFGFNGAANRNGVFINNYENKDVTWETSRQTNLALEATMFKNLSLIAEFYNNYRYNIYMPRTNLPTTLGLEAGVGANVGEARSRGMDLSLDYKFNISDFSFAVRSNFTFAKNKYINYEEPQWAEAYRYTTGQPINRNFGYIAERLFVDDKEVQNSPTQIFSANGKPPRAGDIKYRDLNNDGKIDDADKAYIGYPQSPEIVYGFGFSSAYKGFDLSAFFTGQDRMTFFIDPTKVSPFVPSNQQYILGNTQLLKDFADNHWSPENQNLYALYPRLAVNAADLENNAQTSTWWMRNGRLLRLKSVELGYTLPQRISSKIKLNSCRIYFNGLNLLTWSPFKLWDPEQGGNGFAYPIQKVFNVGLNVTL
ncbi:MULTISPECIES: SusC/RagA family TonB-linked outer membrane protein [unclassified Pedobacter]|uniref:SusC/RagA family TonB-linked outer membrane protein n=1 Tax=unclassified Pedobacter TaxID=2628915 RepID=UPI00180626E3|nr:MULTISPECIES: TonB-dependent receptor [unclassified Pedobacter]NII83065.1 TonB-linked SusC/RagA family outer membrane protein [Pedobacter sp. SG908]NMN37083.1 TonB-linked SusC/RagA family outer membrane protein [Pedobacter sp. SG918]